MSCRLWEGHMVNHQYDKSFQWEQGFNNYLQRLQLGIQYSESKLLQLHIRLTGRMSDKLHVCSGSCAAGLAWYAALWLFCCLFV